MEFEPQDELSIVQNTEGYPDTKAYHVRWSAASVLGNIGSEKAIEPLKLALKDKSEWLGDKVQDVAFYALEKISRRIQKRIPLDAI